MGRFETSRLLVKQFIKRNTEYLKTTSSGNDLIYYCGESRHEWHPRTRGFGGSEEAVICLSTELAKLGWNVTVYNNCGHTPVADRGVIYRPWWEFNPRDKQDVAIVWQWTKPIDWNINAERIFVDMHISPPAGSFTDRDRLARIQRIFFKSSFHRSLYPTLRDDKVAVVANGIDFSILDGTEEKDPYLLINTCSPDRSMGVLPALFKEVKRQVPRARLQWSYGWDLYRLYSADHPERLGWMRQAQRSMDEAGIESLGHLTAEQVGKLYQRGAIFAYPSDFLENDCISVKKAQACGCVPVTTDAGALSTSVQFGIKLPSGGGPERAYHGIEDETTQRLWIDATVDLLNNPEKQAQLARQGAEWARQFSWPRIAARWDEILRGRR
jgi:glycosyltransferase involved in cell wall biosynthesis